MEKQKIQADKKIKTENQIEMKWNEMEWREAVVDIEAETVSVVALKEY